jgi:SPOR domain
MAHKSLGWFLGLFLVMVGFAPAVHAAQDTVKGTYYVLVPQQSGIIRKIKHVVASAWVRQLEGKRYVQAGVFRDKAYARELVAQLKERGLPAFMKQQVITQTARTPIALPPASTLIASSSLNNLPTIPVAPPTPYVPLTRVLISVKDFVRAPLQIPGVFHRQFKGRTYIQVGAFSRDTYLNQQLAQLEQMGIVAVVQKPEEQ